MQWLALIALLALPWQSCAAKVLQTRDHDIYDHYAIHVHPSASPSELASHLGLELQGQLGNLKDHFLFRTAKQSRDVVHEAVQEHKRRRAKRDLGYKNAVLDSILFQQKQHLRPPMVKRVPPPSRAIDPRQQLARPSDASPTSTDSPAMVKGKEIADQLGIADPAYSGQWHLYNPIQLGHDLNVTGVWLQGITGKNTTVCIIDDGLDMDSMDLKANYDAAGSYDFNDKGPEPRPRLSDDRHGTRCAGEVSAVRNDVCGVGVAYDSHVAGIRILSAPITDSDEAQAMTYGMNTTQIYSCSWGPPDDGREMGRPGVLIQRAMLTAIQQGREGKGALYVFAAGNGAGSGDNCNFDGYTNSIYSVTVGAIDREGLHPYYSEKCSAQLVVTYSSGSGDAIHTTDVGQAECYNHHSGTSAAGPLVVGVLSLAMEARPELTWRDFQWLCVTTGIPITNDDANPQVSKPMGKPFSHQYGWGKVDAFQFVEAAKKWELVKPQAWLFSPWQHIRHEIPQGDIGLRHDFEVTSDMMQDANLARVEHVTVTMNINHTRRGDISVELRSPTGMVSHLSVVRPNDDANEGYRDWTFMSVAHWGEDGVGIWSIVAKDTEKNEHTGTLVDWRLKLYGESIDADSQELLPMPTEHDDDDHDRVEGTPQFETLTPGTQPTDIPQPPTPSDSPGRPVHPGQPDAQTTAAFEAPVTAPSGIPADDPDADLDDADHDEIDAPASSPTAAPATDDDNFLPSPFPTFGVTKTTQIWIYAAALMILLFIFSVAIYFLLARRRRIRDTRENYEFEMIADDDDEDPSRGLNGRAAGKAGKRRSKRAGELYDAFAGESDEELFSDDDDESEGRAYSRSRDDLGREESYRDEKDHRAP